MEHLTTIPGVETREIHRPKLTITRLALTHEFSELSARLLIAAIDDGQRLTFFDADHPQRSDPGLYVSLQRSQGQLFVKGANHGWRYPWLEIDRQRAARWLWLCRHANNADHRYESQTMQLVLGVSSIDQTAHGDPAGFLRWLTERLAD